MHQGVFIKKVLKKINITQEELADRIGVSRGHLIKKLKEVELEEDKTGTLKKMLDFLMVKTTDLPPVSTKEKIEYVLRENNINVDDIILNEMAPNDSLASKSKKQKLIVIERKHLEPKTTKPDEITYTPFNQDEPPKIIGIPMYNVPASESNIEMYSDINDTSVVGYLHFPGDHKNCFALPVWGHSMYPVLENGVWVILRPIDVDDIVWGEIYFVEWGNNKMFRRILDTDREDEAILWSDNQEEKILGRAKFGPIRIKLSRIKRVYVVTGIYKKSNH